jgi:hypothetical protein
MKLTLSPGRLGLSDELIAVAEAALSTSWPPVNEPELAQKFASPL